MGRLALGLFAVGYGTNVSTPFLGLYRDRLDLGASQTQAIFTVYVAGILATLFVAGPLSDRFGRRVTCMPFVALSALSSLVLILGRDQYLLLLSGRLLLGVVSGAVIGIGSAWMAELTGPGQELRAALLTTLVLYFGFGIGPVISAAMEAFLPGPLVWPFVVHAIFTAAVLPLLWSVPETHRGSDQPLRIRFGFPRNGRQTFFTLIIPATVWVFGFPSTSFALFPVLLREAMEGFDVAIAGASGALTAWGALLSRPLIARAGLRALPLGMWAGVAGYVLGATAFATDIWPLVLPGALLLGLASGTITTTCLTLVGQLAEADRRGAITSTFYLFSYVGMAMPVFITSVAGAVGSVSAVLAAVTTAAALTSVWVTLQSRHLAL